MSKKRVKGNAANAKLNGEWAKHVRPFGKRLTAHIRRSKDKSIIRKELTELLK